mgnify:CR=1 FL=1
MNQLVAAAPRIAVLVDCDNTSPEALAFALGLIPPSMRIVVRQAYANDATMGQQSWREALNRHAFTPYHLFGTGKNAADIALALDAFELLTDGRADTFYLLTSDADFTALCRKLRTRGGTVFIVGEKKTSVMLQEACTRFHEFTPTAQSGPDKPAPPAQAQTKELLESIAQAAYAEQSRRQLIHAVTDLARQSKTGLVGLGALGKHMTEKYQGFVAKKCGFKGLGAMVASIPQLAVQQKNGGDWVGLASKESRTAR